MEINEMIEVLQAYKEGKTIEHRTRMPKSPWYSAHEPVWNFARYEYRVKKNRPPEGFWIAYYEEEDRMSPVCYSSLEAAEEACFNADAYFLYKFGGK